MTRRKRDELRENVIIAARTWRNSKGSTVSTPVIDLIAAVDALYSYEAAAITGAGARSVKGAPETSAAAVGLAEPVQYSARHEIIALLSRFSADAGGMTDDALERCLHRSHQTISSARNWLVEAGWVRDSGERAPTRSNRRAVVWQLTPMGRQQMKGGSHS